MKRPILAVIIIVFACHRAFCAVTLPFLLPYDSTSLNITADARVEIIDILNDFGIDPNDPNVKVKLPTKYLSPYELKYDLRDNTWRLRFFPRSGQVLNPILAYENGDRYRLYLINKGLAF